MSSNDLDSGSALPEFRQKDSILEEIRNLQQNNEVLPRDSLYNICTDIEKILEFDKEPTLSVLQNKVRKFDTGSELCKELCMLQRFYSNLEVSRGVSEVLQQKKFEKISIKILLKKQLELQREKFYQKQAADIYEQFSVETNEPEDRPLAEAVSVQAEELESPSSEVEIEQTSMHMNKSLPETGRVVGPENVNREDDNLLLSSVAAPMVTDVRSSFWDIMVPEIELRNVHEESEFDIDLDEPERILEFTINELEEIPDIHENPEIPELPNGGIRQSVDLENLPPVNDPLTKRNKRKLPVFDVKTRIKNYSKRARRLNDSVTTERVQVYEGPPTLVHAFTLKHLLETPAVNNGYSGAVRSSVLLRLYTRHQKTEKMDTDKDLYECFQARPSIAMEVPKDETVIGMRQESHPGVKKSLLLDISDTQTEAQKINEAEFVQRNRTEAQIDPLQDTAILKIFEEEVAPPPTGTSDPCLPPPSSGTGNLQDQNLDEPMDFSWFKATEHCALPSEMWRKFEFVRKCLEDIWEEKGRKNLEKSASLCEVLERQHDCRKENLLTLLRVVDKMSLRREVVLKGYGKNVIIYPFEMPFVTEKQYSLREQAPRF